MARPRPDPAELALLVAEAEQAIERLDTRVAEQAGRTVADVIGPVIRRITARWVTTFGAVDAEVDGAKLPALIAAVRVLLAAVVADPSAPVRAALRTALLLGARNARGVLGGRPGRPTQPSRELRHTVAGLANVVDEARHAALERVGSVRDWNGMVGVIGELTQGQHRAEAGAKWAVVRAVSEGTVAEARRSGTELVWVAERDGACLECLAYQGHVVEVGQEFPGGLTFRVGAPERFPDPVLGPPRHPRCRCHLQPWRPEWARGGVSFVDTLKREAQRAVLRGDAGDSNRSRLRAADALLERGTGLPKTVKERARRAVAAGAFPNRGA